MAYDKNIPTVLQLLRTGDIDGTTIARYSIDGDYSPRYLIFDALDDIDTMDITGAIEETMHAILDNGGTPDDLYSAMGLVPESDIDPDTIESGEYTPIDLGYCLPGQLTSIEELPASEIDIQQAFDAKQIENIQTAFWNVAAGNRLPVTRLMASHDFTEWQAFEVCKAADMSPATLSPAALDLIANEDLNHAQMRELRHIAERTGITAPDQSPYKKDLFKIIASPEYPADNLRSVRNLMEVASEHGVSFMTHWLVLDGAQLAALADAVRAEVPMDAIEAYDDGTYSAPHMQALTLALEEGFEKSDIARLLNPNLSDKQAFDIYLTVSSGKYTPEQLDSLCDPAKTPEMMAWMRYGFDKGLDVPTVERFASGEFSPDQMASIYRAAADPSVSPDALDLIADPALTPKQMDSLRISSEQGASAQDVETEKKSMKDTSRIETAHGNPASLSATAKESRAASDALGADAHEEKPFEREALE